MSGTEELKEGQRYLNNSGDIVAIVRQIRLVPIAPITDRISERLDERTFDLFEGNNGLLYNENGSWFNRNAVEESPRAYTPMDLIYRLE